MPRVESKNVSQYFHVSENRHTLVARGKSYLISGNLESQKHLEML
jgi:hypothetical protein